MAVKKNARKEILLKAIADPKFRKQLFEKPEKTFQTDQLSEVDRAAIERLKKTLPAMDEIISSMANEILCGGGGGCGGLA